MNFIRMSSPAIVFLLLPFLLFFCAPVSAMPVTAVPSPLFYDCAGRAEGLIPFGSGPAAGEAAGELVAEGLGYHDAGDLQAAEAAYRKALLMDSSNADAYFGLGQLAEDQEQLDLAEKLYKKALELRPGEGMGYYRLAIVLQDLGQNQPALENYMKAIQLGSNEACSHNNAGIILESEGNMSQALVHYSSAIQADPALSKAWFNRGFVQMDQGRYGEAMQDFNHAIELNGSEPLYYEGRAELYLVLGEQEKAEADYVTADKLAALVQTAG